MKQTSTDIGDILWRGLLWLFLIYLYWQILHFYQGDITNLILSGLYLIQFGVHEVSHIVFMFLPPTMTAAAGSVSEVVFTGLIVIAALKAKSYWAVAFGLIWMMMAFVSMGNYMADAVPQLMPLIGPSPDPTHDWNFVFGQLGWLDASVAIGTAMKAIGWVIGAIGLILGFILIFTGNNQKQ